MDFFFWGGVGVGKLREYFGRKCSHAHPPPTVGATTAFNCIEILFFGAVLQTLTIFLGPNLHQDIFETSNSVSYAASTRFIILLLKAISDGLKTLMLKSLIEGSLKC